MDKLKLILKSDAMPGAGESIAGIIDGDVCYDDFGICYIPAKRIKGILRESALELQAYGRITEDELHAIFGVPGMIQGAAWRLGNGYPENYEVLRDYCRHLIKSGQYGGIFSREAVLAYFSYLRSQTAIADETGTAKKHSLRTIRVLRKELKFEFDVQIDECYREKLEIICRVTRHFGLNRTRGLGKIELSLERNAGRNDSRAPEVLPDDGKNCCALTYSLENLQPLVVNAQLGAAGTSDTSISGSAILGAFARRWLEKNAASPENAHENAQFRSLFLDGEVKFFHAYLRENDERLLPAPLNLAKEKNTGRYLDLAGNVAGQPQLEKVPGYVSPQFDITADPEMCIRYHHQRPEKDRSFGHATGASGTPQNTGQFFQYEAIAPGQSFMGMIVGKPGHLRVLMDLLPPSSPLHLGRSKTAEYGRAIINYQNPVAFIGESNREQSWRSGELLAVAFTSPLILRNENGFVTPDPQIIVEEWQKELKAEITIERQFVNSTTVCGFMGKWRMPKPQMEALSAGSVLILKNQSKRDIGLEFLHKNYGIRTGEGFGRVLYLAVPEKIILNKPDSNSKKTEMPTTNTPEIRDLTLYILRGHADYLAKRLALRLRGDMRKDISKAFVGKLIYMIDNSSSFQELLQKLRQLKDTATGTLKKMRKHLFIEVERIEVERIDDGRFANEAFGNLNARKELNTLLQNLEITQEWWREDLFHYYALFADSYLRLLKYSLRSSKQEGRS